MSKPLVIQDYGRVKEMTFPSAWIESPGQEADLAGPSTITAFHIDFPEAQFGFYNRGRAINRYVAVEFMTVMQMTEHQLTPYEIEIVAPVLRTMADEQSFTIKKLETVNINGECLLKLDGLWHQSDLLELGYFINVDDRFEIVQELHYCAPEAYFDSLLPEVLESILSIKWKPVFR